SPPEALQSHRPPIPTPLSHRLFPYTTRFRPPRPKTPFDDARSAARPETPGRSSGPVPSTGPRARSDRFQVTLDELQHDVVVLVLLVLRSRMIGVERLHTYAFDRRRQIGVGPQRDTRQQLVEDDHHLLQGFVLLLLAGCALRR